MLLLAAIAFAWVAPLVWLTRLADQEIRGAQQRQVDLPPKVARDDAVETWSAELLLVEPSGRSEDEHTEEDAPRLQEAA